MRLLKYFCNISLLYLSYQLTSRRNLKDRDLTSKSDPMCVLYLKDSRSGRFDEIDRSERIQNTHNPEFARKFKVSYYFEEAQRLKFEMYDKIYLPSLLLL